MFSLFPWPAISHFSCKAGLVLHLFPRGVDQLWWFLSRIWWSSWYLHSKQSVTGFPWNTSCTLNSEIKGAIPVLLYSAVRYVLYFFSDSPLSLHDMQKCKPYSTSGMTFHNVQKSPKGKGGLLHHALYKLIWLLLKIVKCFSCNTIHTYVGVNLTELGGTYYWVNMHRIALLVLGGALKFISDINVCDIHSLQKFHSSSMKSLFGWPWTIPDVSLFWGDGTPWN